MRTIRIKKRSMLRTLQRRSGLFTLVQDFAHNVKIFHPSEAHNCSKSLASIYAQRVNFLRAHRVPRWDGPK